MAQADELVLPQSGSDPLRLFISDREASTIQPSDLFNVFVGQADECCEERTPIAGNYDIADDVVSFRPAFGFETGQHYVAVLPTESGHQLIPFRILDETAEVPAVVTEVFPSGHVLPENTLRFYIHFSVPMQPHVAFDHIHLRDASGTVDDAAFMRFKQELWNPDRTRLTVLIDPGRIKRNVATNMELGPVLLEGQEYTLEIEAGWPSADGRSVLPAFEKRFSVGAPLRNLPSLDQWEASRPCVGTRGSLYVTLDRPFDRHLLEQFVRIADRDGGNIEGGLIVGDAEHSLIFTPDAPWSGATIQILVGSMLEDVAANNFHDLLDHVGNETDPDIQSVLTVPLNVACN